MLRAVIVDDEVHCVETLAILLKDYCPTVEVIAKCRSAQEALEVVKKEGVDIVFLDIEMPAVNGFQMLEQVGDIPFAVIFTTSYDQYALKAIRFSALDYLLKPIEIKELINAVNKVSNRKQLPLNEQFQVLLQHVQGHHDRFKKIAVPTLSGFEMIPADELLKCEANDNYTILYLKNGEKVIASRTLKQVEEQLLHFKVFLRVHHSFIVNLNEITRYVRGDGGYLNMSDGSVVNVSKSRKQALLNVYMR